jgi:hypothetical protein
MLIILDGLPVQNRLRIENKEYLNPAINTLHLGIHHSGFAVLILTGNLKLFRKP